MCIRDSRINRTLSATLREINTAADQVSAGADQVSAGAQALSQGATEQASSVQELAATIAEVSHNVSSNAERAKEANDKAIAVSNEVSEGNQKMQQTLAAMGEIRGSSAEIAKIIKTIEDIAFQTNILSLNAAVEAARAGAVSYTHLDVYKRQHFLPLVWHHSKGAGLLVHSNG